MAHDSTNIDLIYRILTKKAKECGSVVMLHTYEDHPTLVAMLEAEGIIVHPWRDDTVLYDVCISFDPGVVQAEAWETQLLVSDYYNKIHTNDIYLVSHDGAKFAGRHNRQYTLDEVDEFVRTKQDQLLYTWPELEPYFDSIFFMYAGVSDGTSFVTEEFSYTLSKILSEIKKGRRRFLFDTSDETLMRPIVLKMQRLIRLINNPSVQYFHLTAGLDAVDAYNKISAKYRFEHKIIMLPVNMFEYHIKQHVHDLIDELREFEYMPAHKEKVYVCFNRVPRPHRVELLVRLYKLNLIKFGYYSFDGVNYSLNDYVHLFSSHTKKVLEHIEPNLPYVLNRSEERDNPVELDRRDIDYHRNSYFSLVTETIFYHDDHPASASLPHYNGVFLSEKIYKPLAYKHPFILMSYPGTLQRLRDLGYKTFHPFIDETYDTIINDDQRIECIVALVKDMCRWSPEKWLEWQQNVKPIVEHNFEHFYAQKPLSTYTNILDHFEE